MGKREKLEYLLKKGEIGYFVYNSLSQLSSLYYNRGGDLASTRRKFKKIFGCYPDLENPRTLNEKINWLKLNVRKDFHTECADKYLCRNYWVKKLGPEVKEHLIPLLFETRDWHDIILDNIPNIPCIVKATHSSGDYQIVRDKTMLDIKLLQARCRYWLDRDYYKYSQEWQYKNAPRRIIIEKLLQTNDGTIPNDYKLHFFNGKLEIVYCSIGRESTNSRNTYDANWNPLPFSWVPKAKAGSPVRGAEIPAPKSFELMKEYGTIIAQDFDYVRVDFYDVDGYLYFGEITLQHGGGTDVFTPSEYDLIYGEKLTLTSLKKM